MGFSPGFSRPVLKRMIQPPFCDTFEVPDKTQSTSSPRVTSMRVIPVAGNDSMLLNLSGAHAPFFTRNVVVLTDDAGHTGAGEVPGGDKIRQVLEQTSAAVVGRPIGSYHEILQTIRTRFGDRDTAG